MQWQAAGMRGDAAAASFLFDSVLFHVSLRAGNFASRRRSVVPFIVFVNHYQVYFSKAVSVGLDGVELV